MHAGCMLPGDSNVEKEALTPEIAKGTFPHMSSASLLINVPFRLFIRDLFAYLSTLLPLKQLDGRKGTAYKASR